jgi:deoxycytidylate deaminase
MQLAFVSKLNSGCISRQVGAAITDSSGSIKAVGWNDVPRGQIPCLLRDVQSLLDGSDTVAYSDYEQTNTQLRTHLANEHGAAPLLRTASGLTCPFCFKDAYNKVTEQKNQVHTRSLHAEENAFLQLAKHGNSGIVGGRLYTTASPCELCSKKAFQLGIKEVVYVDPYPGISSSHVLASGPLEARPTLRLFGGAVGSAYHKLYEAVLPVKDELRARLLDDPPATLL